MHSPRPARVVAMAAAAVLALLPALAFALPPVFLPGASEPGLLKPGEVNFNGRFGGGVQASFDPAIKPTVYVQPGGGGELGLSKDVRTTLDGHAGLAMIALPGAVAAPAPLIPARYFAGGRWGLRIVTPTGAPEFGFGVGGGAVGLPTDDLTVPGPPDYGYVSGDFELMASHQEGLLSLSVVARVGPSFELHPSSVPGLPPIVVPSLGGLGELSAAIELGETFHLTFSVAGMVGHDGTAISEDNPNGSPYIGVRSGIGFIARPAE